MAIVYVLNQKGEPLMPTTRCGHVRILLKEGKARVVERYPFTIQLNYETPNVTQDLYLGIDPGRTNIGLSVVKDNGEPVMEVSLTTRNKDIPKLMATRKAHRRRHRGVGRRSVKRRRAKSNGTISSKCKADNTFERMLPGCEKPIVLRDIKNKEAQFNNRNRPEGWLTPTATQLLRTHINAVKKLNQFVPITDVVLELNKFAFMQLDNPNIKPWEYQEGILYGYHGDVHQYASDQQDNHCIFCKKKIDHYHHLIPRHEGGSDTAQNLAGVCEKHHNLIHTSHEWKDKLFSKKAGLNKKYGALSVLNQIFPRLEAELHQLYPDHVYGVSGRDTKRFRENNNLPKDHYIDAYCIASVVIGNEASRSEIELLNLQQFRRHDRQVCQQEMWDRKYYLGKELVATNRNRAFEQDKDSLAEYREHLTQSVGVKKSQEIFSKLTVKPHLPINKDIYRPMPGSLFIVDEKIEGVSQEVFVLKRTDGRHNGTPDYYIDTNNVKHPFRKCTIIQNNTGLRFVPMIA